ncbi:TAT-variant-translocated molybdopterin oxidoreductase [Pedobacter sp. SD-b]|uniref:TAT-variant-translocated molybdopterin oxidoreductase n=1 Tax=Pedobacter segetis TaxID=2793069 RepID=A0ABS1BM10_9SPHI|nr:TAT-variant-translocated molybdopterin oxidoreductase [Pedobacter segetis]MBK0383336.1 TAT-variant-translocated molybdopterin oxidoreductase [Pedobacter segetis]
MESTKKYWKGLEEVQKTPEFVERNKHEFAEPLPVEELLEGTGLNSPTPRRDFLKAMGFGLGAVSLAACNVAPVVKSVPYLIKPEEVTPGVPNYYVSSYKGGSILVKTREGRPIKIEGNPKCLINNGGLNAQAQAAVLDLYDISKLKGPVVNGVDKSWEDLDTYVKQALSKVQASGKSIVLVSNTVNSPSTKAAIADFSATYPATKHIMVDPVSYSGILKANQTSFGKAVLPQYHFEKANVIVSFGADFLGSWISPVQFTKQYVKNRNLASLEDKKMSRHIHFETGMSLTGTKADSRIPVKLSEEGPALLNLYSAITGFSNGGASLSDNNAADAAVKLAAKELLAAKGAALVVSGSNDPATQSIVNVINSALGSYGSTIDLDNPSYQYMGDDAAFAMLLSDMKAGRVGAVMFLNSNPAYFSATSKDFAESIKKVDLTISFADRVDETAALCQVVAPNHNFLEAWGDENAVEGYYTIVQPTINPIYNTRQAELSMLNWANTPVQDYYTYVRGNWEKTVLAAAGLKWDDILQSGFVSMAAKPITTNVTTTDISNAVSTIIKQSKALDKDIQLQVYQSVAIGSGEQANNPLLQETPDPVSKVTWDNYVAINPKYAQKLGIAQFDIVTVKGANYSIDLPVLHQPGQAQGTVSVALGYGRKNAGKVGDNVGQNAYPFLSFVNGTLQNNTTVTVTKTGGYEELAQTQTHHTYEGRGIIREATFAEYKKDPAHGSGNHGEKKHESYDLWKKYDHPGHNWVMAIDLNACTGCGACIVACSAENNVPVVGKDEVRRRREMHWIRIDRYYTFEDGDKKLTDEDSIVEMGGNMENVSVVHQPMMCQHCDHAPCETVCPVLATVHSNEGINHMAYNRCVGTRYCANNCPYKVRRFNWFNYWNDSRFDNYLNNEFTQLVLNPDVTTRFRGVMEKCSMCLQRIQAGKLQAKIDKRVLVDGDIKVACQQTCPANAIVFGDANDPNSEVSKALTNERAYYVLEELNVQPGVGYMTKITNKGLQEA